MAKIANMKPVAIVKEIVKMYQEGHRYSTRCNHLQKRLGVDFSNLSIEEAENEGKRLIAIGNAKLAAHMA